MASRLSFHPLFRPETSKPIYKSNPTSIHFRQPTIRSFRRTDFDGFAKRVASGEALRDAWRVANNGFEQLLYETTKTAERIDRRYDVSRKFYEVRQSAAQQARVIDRDLEITQKWRSFSLDFQQNWPTYRRQFSDFLDTPIGRSFATLFFVWFALSGWLFRVLIFTVGVLPFAGPLLIGLAANNLVIKGDCPACKRQFMGYKNQTVRCANCGNTVWQPKSDFFSRGSKGKPSSKSDPDIIDVEFEEK